MKVALGWDDVFARAGWGSAEVRRGGGNLTLALHWGSYLIEGDRGAVGREGGSDGGRE